MTSNEHKLELVKRNIKSYPDFPKPGILFRYLNYTLSGVNRDIFSVMANPDATDALFELLIAHYTQYIPNNVQAICALDSRGFLLGPLIAHHFRIPFIPIRKKGKLPGEVTKVSYDLEYGSETFEIQNDALSPNSNVSLVDDLLATGGSLSAGCELINLIGSTVHHCLVIIELEKLEGRKKLPCPVHSLIKL